MASAARSARELHAAVASSKAIVAARGQFGFVIVGSTPSRSLALVSR
jgi:hypothetical protein